MENVEDLDWMYLGEGNANVVLYNSGCQSVIRVKKAIPCANSHKEVKEYCKIENVFSSQQNVEYISLLKRFAKIAGYIADLKLISVSSKFLEDIDEEIKKDRPLERQCKAIDVNRDNVLLMPHVGILSFESNTSVSIELKPKCGFLPFSKGIPPCHRIKYKVCRYCMHQITKFKSRKINEISSYCPLNLFSACSCHMQAAFQSLFKTPQNNLLLCVNGKKVTSNYFDGIVSNVWKIGSTSQLIEILVDILIHDSWQSHSKSEYEDKSSEIGCKFFVKKGCGITKNGNISEQSSVCDYSYASGDEGNDRLDIKHCQGKSIVHFQDCKQMGNGGILNLVKSLQILDTCDIEEIYLKYQNILKSNHTLLEEIDDFNSSLWENFFSSINNEIIHEEIDPNLVEICKYLVSSTFKDCSIVITLQHSQPSEKRKKLNSIYFDDTQSYYNYDIKLIDIDPRHAGNIPYYYHLDHKIVSNFIGQSFGVQCC